MVGPRGQEGAAQVLAGSLENTDHVERHEGSPLLAEAVLAASSSVPPGYLLPAPPHWAEATWGWALCAPQDPAKAQWLAGSSALLSGLLLFLLLPPLLFSHVEGWSYVEGFYFAFMTLSTVGFGDYVIGESPSGRQG